MRPVLALQLCLALFQAFLLAPAQHVHETEQGEEGHGHSAVVHSHFSPHTTIPVRGRAFTDDDGPTVWALDTFTIVLPTGVAPAIPKPASGILFAPKTVVGIPATIEERAHDPPGRRLPIPRAPPA
ncbi:MAG: hypothetical protein LAP40_03415 [Acidobacteriia bacterium]|nr:hypothetical protein [Terriglobia bacterium]